MLPGHTAIIKVILDQKEQSSIFETEARCEIVWMSESVEDHWENSHRHTRADGRTQSIEFKLKQTNVRNNVFLRIKKFNEINVL